MPQVTNIDNIELPNKTVMNEHHYLLMSHIIETSHRLAIVI